MELLQNQEKNSFVLREKTKSSVDKILDSSDLSYKVIQKWVEKFQDEGKMGKYEKLNKKKT